MPWFKSDDSFWRHPKVRRLGKDRLSAVGLWELSGTWCSDNIATNVLDGFVPDEQVEVWDPKHRCAKRLVEVGLWERVEAEGEHGYVFHDWADYNPTKASVEAEREEWRKKKAAQRGRKVSPGDTTKDTSGTRGGSPTEFPDPVPVPVPVPISGHLEGGGSPDVTHAAPHPQRPSEHCDKHPGGTTAPCRACGDARRAAAAWDTDTEQRKATVAAILEAARADPRTRCEHGTDGGTVAHPDTGLPLCAFCRAAMAS